jgi:Flp pilus assembly pilin Flp
MLKLLTGMRIFLLEKDGAIATEYALLATLIAVVIAVSVALFGTNLNTLFSNAAAQFAAS